MRKIAIITICLFITFNIFGQDPKVQEFVAQGVDLHDQGKYSEAIDKYKAALAIDSKSDVANYEIAYSYFSNKEYNNAIKHGNIVIKSKSVFQEEAYMVLGNSYDLLGDHKKAVKSYEKGLSQFPKSNLLNFNLALTYFNSKDFEKAEKYAIVAVKSKLTHPSSHLLLSMVMQERGRRVQSVLAAYYFLMIEPNSNRSLIYYNNLLGKLNHGVERKDATNISISLSPLDASNEFSTAEMMISMLAAVKYTEENAGKNEIELFIETNKSVFSTLSALKKDKKGFWWDFYVDKFQDLDETGNLEAFTYYISQSKNDELINSWLSANPEKLKQLEKWMNK